VDEREEVSPLTAHGARAELVAARVTMLDHRYAKSSDIYVCGVGDDSASDEDGKLEHEPWLWALA
jgi:hypothetical protein